jgi:hypothetical protein
LTAAARNAKASAYSREAYLARWAAGPIGGDAVAGERDQFRFTVYGDGSGWPVTRPIAVRGVGLGAAIAFPRPRNRRPGRFEEEYQLSGVDGSTKLTQSIRAWPRGAFRVVEPLIKCQLRRLIASDLERLRALVLEVYPKPVE